VPQLPPRKVPNQQNKFDVSDESFTGDIDDVNEKPRLDRRRNRVVRKLSLKKSKSSKSVTENKTPELIANVQDISAKEHKQVNSSVLLTTFQKNFYIFSFLIDLKFLT
jgi:hypothetical protein